MNIKKQEGLKDWPIFKQSIEMIFQKNYYIEHKDDCLYIHIFFDEITIKNSFNKAHIIKELFVTIKFAKNLDSYELDSDLRGFRTFITKDEAKSHYLHSHLSSYGSFCLGSGPLNKFMKKYGLSLTINKSNIDLFDEMLLMIYNYVRWESLEGTPYRSISNLKSNKTINQYERIDMQNISNITYSSLASSILIALFEVSNQISLGENIYKLKFNNQDVLNLIDDFDPKIKNNLFLYKGTDGYLYKKNENISRDNTDPIRVLQSIKNPKFPIILESGKIIKHFTSDDNEDNEQIKFAPFINKSFLSTILSQIEKNIENQI